MTGFVTAFRIHFNTLLNSALLYLCNDIGEPHTGDYQYQLNRTIVNLCQATSGRALILFTSYAQLKRTSKAISRPLAKNDIAVFEQGDGSSPSSLLETQQSIGTWTE